MRYLLLLLQILVILLETRKATSISMSPPFRQVDIHSRGRNRKTCSVSLLHLAIENDENQPNDDTTENSSDITVSDAEALLACRAYLQKKNRLGKWRRQRQGMDGFWDPEDENEWMTFSSDSILDSTTSFSLDTSYPSFVLNDDQDDLLLFDDDDNSPEPTASTEEMEEEEPSESFQSFSKASHRRWADPEFRKHWYKQRWGDKELPDKRTQVLKRRLKTLNPEEFLQSSELAEMTEEEIELAITMYLDSGRKRSRTRKLKESEADEKGDSSNRTTLSFEPDVHVMKELQRKRSERSKRAYQNRQKGDNTLKVELQSTDNVYEVAETPQEAVLKIHNDIQTGKLPNIDDVELMMRPSKLSKRKDTLRLILSESFGLSGKCVPATDQDGSTTYLFVTDCTVGKLGDFVISKLKQT